MHATTFDNNFTLRLIRPDDLEGYFHLIDNNRKRLEDFFAGTVAITKTIEDTEVHLKEILAKTEQKDYFPFIITDDAANKIIASLQIKSIDWRVPKAELGYFIDAAYEGRGLITKAISKIIAYCFDELGLNKVYIRTYEGNISSRKVAEKNGLILEGILRKDYKTTGGELVDLMYYGIIREEYSGQSR